MQRRDCKLSKTEFNFVKTEKKHRTLSSAVFLSKVHLLRGIITLSAFVRNTFPTLYIKALRACKTNFIIILSKLHKSVTHCFNKLPVICIHNA